MPLPWSPQRIGFQTKVLAPIVVVLALLLGGTLSMVNRIVRDELRAGAAQRLATAESVFHHSQEIRVKNLLMRFRTVPNEPRFKAVSQLGDPPTFQVLLADLVAESGAEVAVFTAPDGKIVAGSGRDAAFGQSEFEAMSAASVRRVVADGQPVVDLASVGGRLYDAVSIPTELRGSLVGVLTLGVELGPAVAEEFKRLTRMEIAFLTEARVAVSTLAADLPPIDAFTATLARPSGSAGLNPDSMREITVAGEHFFGTSGRLAALDPKARFTYVLLSTSEPHRNLLRETQRRIGLVGLAGIGLSAVLVWLVVHGATQPLRNLGVAAEQLGRGEFQGVVPVTSRDECGELAAVFNRMAENLRASRAKLQEAHDQQERRVSERTKELVDEIDRRERAQRDATEAAKRLVVASRLAGMAEVATGVLHNVGNVLNSVNVSVSVIVEQLRKSKTAGLARAARLLRDHEADLGDFVTRDPKGKQLPAFVAALSDQLTREQALLIREAQGLQQNIEHIKQIVAAQQSYAKVSGATEFLAVRDLIEDAVRMAAATLSRRQIEVVREFADVPPVFADRHMVLQILVNLVTNADHALSERPEGRRLVLRIAAGEAGMVRVEVSDNGLGIPGENLARIFNHGFTTKKTGHGFGLHSGANAAKEMGGSLGVRSDGPGTGATFVLELPTRQKGSSTPSSATRWTHATGLGRRRDHHAPVAGLS